MQRADTVRLPCWKGSTWLLDIEEIIKEEAGGLLGGHCNIQADMVAWMKWGWEEV
jgi:hypothetical protein